MALLFFGFFIWLFNSVGSHDAEAKPNTTQTSKQETTWHPTSLDDPVPTAPPDTQQTEDHATLSPKEQLFSGIDDINAKDVRIALERGADVNEKNDDGDAPLFAASYRADRNIIELLISHGAKINTKSSDGMTALDQAIAWNHHELEEYLRSKGATSTGKGQEIKDKLQDPEPNNDHWDMPSSMN